MTVMYSKCSECGGGKVVLSADDFEEYQNFRRNVCGALRSGQVMPQEVTMDISIESIQRLRKSAEDLPR